MSADASVNRIYHAEIKRLTALRARRLERIAALPAMYGPETFDGQALGVKWLKDLAEIEEDIRVLKATLDRTKGA